MLELVYLAVGALVGVFLRYEITKNALFLSGLPVSVLIINILGSFILGLTMATVQQYGLDQRYILLVGIGFCGSFTTMSTFAFESANLLDAGRLLLGALDIILNVGLSIFAIFLGRALILALTMT
ncbi:MAG: fluoride efflux transporter CrcB [Nitrososphaerales archaeon]